MIVIKAKVEGESVNYECKIEGTGEDIANKAAMFGVAARPEDKRRADNAEPVEG